MISKTFLSICNKTKTVFLISMLIISDASFGGFFGATLNLKIVLDEKNYDNFIGEAAPPDVYGKIQINGKDYVIKLHEDTYVLNINLDIDKLKNGDRIDIQLFDKDPLEDETLAIGYMTYEGNPTMESKIGNAVVTLKYES